jgi:hypothetical protein
MWGKVVLRNHSTKKPWRQEQWNKEAVGEADDMTSGTELLSSVALRHTCTAVTDHWFRNIAKLVLVTVGFLHGLLLSTGIFLPLLYPR